MYVFILIALRTLRFEPGYVLLAGGCAAFGWLTLFLYAVWGSDGAVFTHSYVEYVTSYKILRGAEIDKILSILCGNRDSRLVARQGSRSPYPVGRRRTGGQRSVALLRARGRGTDPAGRRGRREHAMQRMPRRHTDDRSAQLYRPLAVSFGAGADRAACRVSIAAGAGDPATVAASTSISAMESWRASAP